VLVELGGADAAGGEQAAALMASVLTIAFFIGVLSSV